MIVVNKEHLLTVARTFMQIYNDKDAAIEQLKKDKEYGHLLEDRYNIIVNTLNKASITIWAYKSPLSATSVVGAFRPVTSLAKDGAINTYSLVTLCCDLFDNVLKVNDLNIKDVYSSHWLTYLFEEIFTLVLPLYISSDFKYTLVQDTLTIQERTTYTTTAVAILSTKNDGVVREYPSNIIKPVLDDAERFFADKENAGMCFGNANTYGGDLVTVKLRTTKDPHTGFIITFSTLFHELIHSVGNQLVKFETDMKTINLNVILRQLMLGYVYWILKESLTIWKPEPIAETVEVPATETPA